VTVPFFIFLTAVAHNTSERKIVLGRRNWKTYTNVNVSGATNIHLLEGEIRDK
jgi:hypothetical protein